MIHHVFGKDILFFSIEFQIIRNATNTQYINNIIY